MHRIAWGLITLLAFAPALRAEGSPQDKAKDTGQEVKPPDTPAQQYQALVQEYQKAYQDFLKEYQAAKTQEDKNKVYQEKYPQPAKFAPRMMDFAEKNAKDP